MVLTESLINVVMSSNEEKINTAEEQGLNGKRRIRVERTGRSFCSKNQIMIWMTLLLQEQQQRIEELEEEASECAKRIIFAKLQRWRILKSGFSVNGIKLLCVPGKMLWMHFCLLMTILLRTLDALEKTDADSFLSGWNQDGGQ
jgi:hypothetical protein